MPNLWLQQLVNPDTVWMPLRVRGYNGRCKVLDLAMGTVLWIRPGQPVVPLRQVLRWDPKEPELRRSCSASVYNASCTGAQVTYGKRRGSTSGTCLWAACTIGTPWTRHQQETLKVDFYAHARTIQRDPKPQR